ncbi:glycosyltransferase family 4 protein [Devosia psychrophila]|uniref:Glycosyltransferase involved in cell wall bisynthesis n=1 Tax=Devosia psychrophila TaxID=728005 RepID=A0A0F5Q3C5_9HYPH|nr:glycosyltransferase family 4 protein [Devosia psychrophila]KKC34559.1 hypothetical protein WH91_02180 [Devosia psychrophila]SFD35302.1 Glycosyltransferase involved in cell wall bisynthesis [Devosia psychrophila]
MARIAVVAGLASSLVNFRGPLIEALLDAGHEVHAIAPPADQPTLGWLAARNVTFTPIDLARSGLSPSQDLRTFWQLAGAFQRLKPNLVMAYTIKPVIYGTLAAALARVPRRCAIITGLGYAFTDGQPSMKRRAVNVTARLLYRFALGRAHNVLFQNPDDLAAFQQAGILRHGARTAIVNGSGVDTDYFAPVPLAPTPSFLLIARLVADKGIAEFIAAARITATRHPESRFHLVGPRDPNPAALDPRLLEDAIRDGVLTYHGELADVRPAIAASSIYVLPSYREGTPRSVLEAMAMGRPVITTDAPGCRETVRDGWNGLLVPIKAINELADAMSKLAIDAALREKMGAASRNMALTKYRAVDVANSIIDACGLTPASTP